MRKLVALVLVAVTAMMGPAAPAVAQAPVPVQAGTLSGRAVDAAGRALRNERIELLRDSVVIQSATTGARGEWAFAGLPAGDYIVRMVVNKQVAGLRVTMTAGQSVSDALIVASSAAAASPAFLLALGLLGGLAAGAAVAAIVITTVVVVQDS